MGVLAGYLFLILTITVLSRTPSARRYELVPFWNYGNPNLKIVILLDIMLFISFGFLGTENFGWRIILAGAGFSFLIEITQLISSRG